MPLSNSMMYADCALQNNPMYMVNALFLVSAPGPQNPVRGPANSWWIHRLLIAIQSWQISCKHLFPFPSYNTSNN